MLYIFHGTDIEKSRSKAKALLDSLRIKRPGATYLVVDAHTWNTSIVDEHVGGQGLFSNKYIIYLDRITEKTSHIETLVESLDRMKQSDNIFVLFEGKVPAHLKKSFEKYADKIVATDSADKKQYGEEFTIFTLADAVGERNPVKAWSLYRTAIEKGHEPEAIVGTLFWHVKSMIVASRSKTATESGLSPFVFSKAKKASQLYSESERLRFLKELVSIYHDGHRGLLDMELSIERFLLSIDPKA